MKYLEKQKVQFAVYLINIHDAKPTNAEYARIRVNKHISVYIPKKYPRPINFWEARFGRMNRQQC